MAKEESVFLSLLDRIKKGRVNRPMPQEKTVLTGNRTSPESTPMQQKQQDFLDIQSQKIAQDIYSRTVYYDADRIGSYNDYRAMDMSPEVSAALDIITDECLEASTIIPLLSGEKITIEELYNQKREGFWVYSKNIKTGEVEPATCQKVAYKGVQDVYEIIFDDNSSVVATSEHMWLLKKEKDYKTTKELKIGDSIEPFYTKISNETDRIKGYEMILEQNGKYEYTHRIVKRKFWNDKKGVCHHVDFNKLNNEPSNLEVMDWFEHQKLHASFNSEKWKNEEFANKMKKIFSETNSINGPYWSNKSWREKQIKKFKKAHKIRYSNMSTEERKEKHGLPNEKNPMFKNGHKISGEKNGRYLHNLKHEFETKEIIDAYKKTNNIDEACDYLNTNKDILRKSNSYKSLNIQRWEDIQFIIDNISLDSLKKACINSENITNLNRSFSKICKINGWKPRKVYTFLNKKGFVNWSEFTKSINHSVKEIKYVGKRKTYDLVNVGEHHNFAVLTSDEKSGVFTHNCVTRDERGDILSIYSENSRIKTVLKDLFKNRLNIEYNLTFWIREMIKFGDCFIKLEVDQKEGIYDVRMLPVAEIHREEAFDGNINSSRFKWDINNMYFEEFQIAHFRLVSDGTKIPYGRSILDPARKLWKQLQLAEDAMLVYRIIRAPERRVHYIEVGNLESADVLQYIEKVKAQIKKSPIVDQKNGQMNLKFNPLTMEEDYFVPIRGDKSSRIETLPGACLALDTKIELLDGRSLELNEIIKEYNDGKELWAYSINPNTGEIVPGPITWAGVTRKNTDVVKITLDNGETITTTPDHKFPTKFNGIKEAKDLQPGESMWAFNKKFSKIKGAGKKRHRNTYEMVYDHQQNKWVYTHRFVANYFKNLEKHEIFDYREDLKNEEKNTIHHKDFDRYNNNPDNLCFMNSKDHFYYHQDNMKNLEIYFGKDKIEEWKNDRKQGLIKYFKNLSEEELELKREIAKVNFKKGSDKLQELLKDSTYKREFYEKTSKSLKISKNTKEYKQKQSEIAKKQWQDENFRNTVIEKQKIKYSNEMLQFVVNKFKEGKNAKQILTEINSDNSFFISNFLELNKDNKQIKKMSNGFTHNNLYKMMKEFGYKNWADFKVKAEFFNHKIVSVELLSDKQDTGTITIDGQELYHNFHNFALSVGIFTQNSNLGEIQDVEYLQNKLFAALKVPKTYLNYSETMPGGSTLSQADLRFSRTINRIQENIVIELRRIANIHLFLLGFEDDMDNFDLKLTNPSTQQELLKLETMKARLEVFKEMFTGEATSPVSYTWAMEYIMGFSKTEIKQILRQKKVEKKMFSEIETAPEQYMDTGLFADIDSKFKINALPQPAEGEEGAIDDSIGGGDFGGGDFGGGDLGGGLDFGGDDLGGDDLGGAEETIAENVLFEEETKSFTKNNITENLVDKNKNLNTKTKRLVDSITERLEKINKETGLDENGDDILNGGLKS